MRAEGEPGVARARFRFGDRPPPDGSGSRSVRLRLGPKLREALDAGATAKLTIVPYVAFVERDRLRVR